MFVAVNPAGVVVGYSGIRLERCPDGAQCFEIADSEQAKFDQPGTKTFDRPSRTITVTPPPPLPSPPDYTALRQRLVALAQSSVGVVVDQTTQAQRLALVACLLLRADAIDPVTMAIKPLNTWLYPP
jgi:hypothetical protein